MNPIPYIPDSAPFTQEQRAWLNGYFAGLLGNGSTSQTGARAPSRPDSARPAEPLLVMFGSQTGTAEGLARRLANEAKQRGFEPRLLELNGYGSVDWDKPARLAIVTSTWGEGDPPDNAALFWAHLNSAAPNLERLSYSVLALGDRNYADFCGAGKKFDLRLEQLGAKRIQPRADCESGDDAAAKEWMERWWTALATLPATTSQTISNGRPLSAPAPGGEIATSDIAHGRSNPFPARLLRNQVLNGAGSEKEIRHVELSLEGSGLSYEPGDALGVAPANCPELVEEILSALGCDGEEAVPDPKGAETSLRHGLLCCYDLGRPTPALVQAVAERGGDPGLKRMLAEGKESGLAEYLQGREVIDLLLGCRPRFAFGEFVTLLRKLQPRLYSISSSPRAHPGEVHLTVGVVRYEAHGRRRKGVCSTFLADRAGLRAPVPVFVQRSHGFRLPTDGQTPIIMIGPGTGIAPFRAFLEERRATGATGRNWLFFGAQRGGWDFLYREELEAFRNDGTLTRLETAFSRDQPEKIYVQHRLLEHAKEVWAWLEAGAHVYVCGDAKRMAKDVDAALHWVVEIAGGRIAEEAGEYVRRLKTAKRYQRDVY